MILWCWLTIALLDQDCPWIFVSQREEDFCRSKKHHIFCCFLWFYQRALTRQDIFFCFFCCRDLIAFVCDSGLPIMSATGLRVSVCFRCLWLMWLKTWKPENLSWLRHADWWSWAACNGFVAVGTPRSIFRSVERWPLDAPRSSKSLPVFIDFYPKKVWSRETSAGGVVFFLFPIWLF